MEKKSGHEGIPYQNRPDFAIDTELKSEEFDNWLTTHEFSYEGTFMSSSGGYRQYFNQNLIVCFFKYNGIGTNLAWFMDRKSDNRELGHGLGFNTMIKKIQEESCIP